MQHLPSLPMAFRCTSSLHSACLSTSSSTSTTSSSSYLPFCPNVAPKQGKGLKRETFTWSAESGLGGTATNPGFGLPGVSEPSTSRHSKAGNMEKAERNNGNAVSNLELYLSPSLLLSTHFGFSAKLVFQRRGVR